MNNNIDNNNLKYNNHNGVVTHWWGVGIFFSDHACNVTKKIGEYGITVAGVMAALGTLGIFTAPELDTIAATLFILSAVLWIIFSDSDGHGIVID